jgi:hypothetical protein
VVLHSARFSTSSDTTVPSSKRLRGSVDSRTSLSFNRCDNGACILSPGPQELAWERVFFPDTLASVQSLNVALVTTASAASAPLLVAVAPDRTLLFSSGQGPAGQSSGETESTAVNLGYSTATVEFGGSGPSQSQLSVTRGFSANGTNAAKFTVFTVQFVK